MRTIKFRGKGLVYGRWIFGDLYRTDQDGGMAIQYYDEVDGWMTEDVDEKTIGQFTGLLDIHGREIYEGDVVRVRVTNDRFTRNPRFEIGSVKYDDYYGRWDNGFHGRFFSNRMEVIGNIHDNPELIEGVKA